MSKFILAVAILTGFGCVASASDPAVTRPRAKPALKSIVPNPILQILAKAVQREREITWAVVGLARPQPRVAAFVMTLGKDDPNFRIAQLLDELEDLKQARKLFQQFWMNNQPSTLTYERLPGAIGP